MGRDLNAGTLSFLLMPQPTTISTTYKISCFYFAYTQRISRRLFFDIFMYVIDVF